MQQFTPTGQSKPILDIRTPVALIPSTPITCSIIEDVFE